jgi:hypothetical protein
VIQVIQIRNNTPSPPYPAGITRPASVKRSVSPSDLIDCSTPFLAWWQELILNWVASWDSISLLHVTSPDGEYEMTWDMPTDVELARLELEELLDVQGHRGDG